MNKVILLRGIQASGKSTWAKAWEAEDSEHRIIISWDGYRNSHGTYWVPSREDIIKAESLTAFKLALNKGLSICVDNMNLSERSTQCFIKAVEEFNNDKGTTEYEIEYIDFFTSVDECVARDAKRSNPIGEKVIRDTWKRYRTDICTRANKMEVERLKPFNNNLSKAIIFDLDATLAFNTSGRPYWGEGCADGIKNDSPNVPIINLLKHYLDDPNYQVIIVTGRIGSNAIKTATEQWLSNQNIDINKLTFNYRDPNDFSKGDFYKLQAINNISKTYNVELIIDDSKKVVKALRDAGYTVLQPNEGEL